MCYNRIILQGYFLLLFTGKALAIRGRFTNMWRLRQCAGNRSAFATRNPAHPDKVDPLPSGQACSRPVAAPRLPCWWHPHTTPDAGAVDLPTATDPPPG